MLPYAPHHHHYYHPPRPRPHRHRHPHSRPQRHYGGGGNYNRKSNIRSPGRKKPGHGHSARKKGGGRGNQSQRPQKETLSQLSQPESQAQSAQAQQQQQPGDAAIPDPGHVNSVEEGASLAKAAPHPKRGAKAIAKAIAKAARLKQKRANQKKTFHALFKDENGQLIHPKHKTVMCANLRQGFCRFGDLCAFAHSKSELRDWKELPRAEAKNEAKNVGDHGVRIGGRTRSSSFPGGRSLSSDLSIKVQAPEKDDANFPKLLSLLTAPPMTPVQRVSPEPAQLKEAATAGKENADADSPP